VRCSGIKASTATRSSRSQQTWRQDCHLSNPRRASPQNRREMYKCALIETSFATQGIQTHRDALRQNRSELRCNDLSCRRRHQFQMNLNRPSHDRETPSTGIAVPVTKSTRSSEKHAMPAKSAMAPHRAAASRQHLSCRPSICSRARAVRSVSIQPAGWRWPGCCRRPRPPRRSG